MAAPTTYAEMLALSNDSTFKDRVRVAMFRRARAICTGAFSATPTNAQNLQHQLAVAVLAPGGLDRWLPSFALATACLGTVDGTNDLALLGAVGLVHDDIAQVRNIDGAKIA